MSKTDYRDLAARYALALLVGVLSVYLRVLLTPLFGAKNVYQTCFLAIVFSAWYCGVGPSILSILVVLSGVWYWLLPKQGTFALLSVDLYGMIGFLVFSGLIIAIGESSRRSRSRIFAAEQEALRAKTRFETFMNNSPALTYLKDEDGRIIYANRTLRNRFHLPASADTTDLDIFPADIAAEFRKNDALVLQENRAMEFVERSVEEDGEHVWLTVKFPMQDADGRRLLGGKSFDITDRHRAEEALREARQELELRVEERTAELKKANQSLRDLSARLLQMRDEERRRLARELHDSAGQLIAAISMNLARLQPYVEALDADVQKLVAETESLVGRMGSEIRTISHLLHPPLLDEVGLVSALHWYVEEFSARSAIKTELHCPAHLVRLPADMEIAIFRIVQECLGNIHRHSGSATATIRVDHDGPNIVVAAQDSGRGVGPEKMAGISEGRGGVGFRGMAERVRYLGGNLAIDSNPGGTIVTATLPLPSLNREAGSHEVA